MKRLTLNWLMNYCSSVVLIDIFLQLCYLAGTGIWGSNKTKQASPRDWRHGVCSRDTCYQRLRAGAYLHFSYQQKGAYLTVMWRVCARAHMKQCGTFKYLSDCPPFGCNPAEDLMVEDMVVILWKRIWLWPCGRGYGCDLYGLFSGLDDWPGHFWRAARRDHVRSRSELLLK